MLMEVSGIVVAASEKISLEHCVGLLLMLYHADMEIHFCILVCDGLAELWENIYVNRCCHFSDLKLGMLQTFSGGKIFLLKTTETSTFSYMDGLQIKKSHVLENLERFISVRGIDDSSPLVSYQGSVTEVRNSGIYELDSKVLLCTTFNGGCMVLAAESEVIVSNAHLIKDYRGVPILVCCGSSCVKYSKPDHIKDKSHAVLNVNFCIEYGLNVFDLFWFERLLSGLKKRFNSLIADKEILFQQDSSFIKNTLEYFLCFENETTNKKLSLVEEFLSSPHRCFPFLQSRLPTGCCVPDLSQLLDDVIENALWLRAGPRWKWCVGTRVNSVIIGILYVSTNGDLYVADGTLKLPIILSEDCDDCCHHQNIMKEFKKSDNASIVAIQEYDIIVENISCKNGMEQSVRYIRTSLCRLYSLFDLSKSTLNDSFTVQKFSDESVRNMENDENIIDLFEKNIESNENIVDLSKKNMENDENIVDLSEKNMENDENIIEFHSKSEEMSHRFLILTKIWTLRKKVPYSSSVLALLLSENSEIMSDESKTNLEDTFNFYDSTDDVEFANLISQLDFLHIEDKECKIGYLSFEAADQESVVFPGHVYCVQYKDSNFVFDNRMFSCRFTPDMKMVHDSACTGNHSLEDYEGAECHGIKEIISKRQLNRNWFVTCVLQDKAYEDEGHSRSTLCLLVKSDESSMKVYAPHFAGRVCGLLPGASLRLFGFLCFCSQGGTLYLRAASRFGILVQPPKALAGKCRSGSTFHCPLRRICFVVKVLSAEIFSACSECGRRERCTCRGQQKIGVRLCALVDDGRRLLLAHCMDETAKKILNVDVIEWRSLVSYVESSHQLLKFSDKVSWSQSSFVSFMNQVFNAYCSSKATSRKLMLEYVYVPTPCDSSPADLPSILCRSAEDVDHHKLVKKLYLKLMNNNSLENIM